MVHRLLPLTLLAAATVLVLAVVRPDVPRVTVLEPPGWNAYAASRGDRGVLVNGRRVTPAGRVLRTQSYSWGLALSPDGATAVLVNRDAIQIVPLAGDRQMQRVPDWGEDPEDTIGAGTYMGVAFSPDGRRLYFGSADDGLVRQMDLETGAIETVVDLNQGGFADSFVGDFAVSADGLRLYALDQFNFRLVTVDLGRGAIVRSVGVGRHPFAVALSADGRHAWVTNVGMYEYPLLPGVTEETRAQTGLVFPAYGVPSREAEQGTVAEGVEVPGLGDPNAADAMSVFEVDLEAGAVVRRVKTGFLVGAKRDDLLTVGGASPAAVAVGRDAVYVANATNDTVSEIDPASGEIAAEIELTVPGLEGRRGVPPFGLALDDEADRLYVACAGLNAVAVVDVRARRVAGYVPAGWFTSLVALSRDRRSLVVASAKGLGSGPNGGRGFVAPARGAHPGDVMQGTLQVVPVPGPAALERYTHQVIANTYVRRNTDDDPRHPVPPLPGLRESPIRHVVFVVKENRTFDQVFGQRAGVTGDPTLAELGLGVRVASEDGSRVLERVDVSPNHHALADRFAISDNFYCDADQSNTGHRWVAGVYPNEWVEVNARSRIEPRIFSTAPGRRNVAGSNATVLPEDYNEAGALWEHLDRHGVTFFNFGLGTEMPATIEDEFQRQTGIRMAVSYPLPAPLFERSSRRYPTYNMAIPDQYRMDMFETDLEERWLSGREPFPRLITLVLPNDHLTGEHPAAGYPFRASYMADNDLALGRLVERLSRTPFWNDMLVVIVEDDPQGGQDHVEAHRSVLMFAGPWVKRGYVSHTLASFGSVMRLIFTILDLPSLNQFDAAATLPRDMFATRPDPAPYTRRPIDPRLFDPAAALGPFDRGFDWSALAESPIMDDPDDMRQGYERRKD